MQYRGYIWDLLHGDLRLSTKYRNRSVNELLAQSLPVSGTLGAIAFLIATAGGIWVGAYAAVRHDRPADTLAMLGALLAISIPTFVIGPLLILVFALKLRWLPVGGWGGIACLILPGDHAGQPVCGLHRAADADEHARGAGAGFHPHGEGEGARAMGRSFSSTR